MKHVTNQAVASPNESPVVIFTDGVSKGNPGPGGWGACISRNGRSKELCGGSFYATNMEMELVATIKALEALRKPLPVRLCSGSETLVKSMTEWIEDWKSNGWRKARGKPLANRELWQRLDQLNSLHAIEWVWIPKTGGDPGSMRANQLANQGVGRSD